MDFDKSLNLFILPALRISDLRALRKARGFGYRATCKIEDFEKTLSLFEKETLEKQDTYSESEPVEVEEDTLVQEHEEEGGEDPDSPSFPRPPSAVGCDSSHSSVPIARVVKTLGDKLDQISLEEKA
ncbi:hypothetical protein NDU88_007303 [Pleurodeles waltl]|uniref:Uncharacterized protein n=1 Tax=Pleurodeles waltl TaxID=8319 RepID=A0AAV7SSH5_PLEWA|nr:hypothetical protein NDU88_007303 [Pleurodeles waltl]